MKRHITLFFLSMLAISIHYAQASLIPPLTEVEKLVYPCGFSETTSFWKREVVYSKDCVHIFATEGLFVHPLHECNVPHKAKEVCSSCYTRLFTNNLNVTKNRIGNLEKQHSALHVDVLNTERAISKLRGLSTRLSNNYESAHEKMLSSEKTIDNKPFMELIYCAVESPIEVLNIINAYLALIAVVKKADCLSFRPLKGVSDDPQYRNAILKNMIEECCDHAPKLLIPQQDIVTCVQFGNVRTFSTTIYSVAYEEGGITTECCIACPVACHISELFNGFSIEYKDLEDVAKEQRKHIEKRSAEFGVELEKFEIPANDFDILRKNVLRQDEQLKKLAYHLNMGEIPQLPDFDAYDINLFYEGKIVIHHH